MSAGPVGGSNSLSQRALPTIDRARSHAYAGDAVAQGALRDVARLVRCEMHQERRPVSSRSSQ